MPTDNDILSERAEAAVGLLHRTLGQHQREISNVRGDEAVPRLGREVHNARLELQQTAIARLASITEAFCVDRLMSVAQLAVDPDASSARRAVFEDAIKGATGSWASIRGAFEGWHGVRPDWKPLEGVQEVRNAIAHGLGTLTHRQAATRSSTTDRIGRVGLTVDSENAIVIRDGDVVAISQVCEDLIRAVDERTR